MDGSSNLTLIRLQHHGVKYSSNAWWMLGIKCATLSDIMNRVLQFYGCVFELELEQFLVFEMQPQHSQSPVESDDHKYTNYVDPSTIIINHYQKHSLFESPDTYIHKIQHWLNSNTDKQDNKPLVFSTQPGSGQISMLVKWMDHHLTKNVRREKNLVVVHFASMGGNNTNYFYAIYRLLIKLRESLKIKQKVELLEEKIRKYFAYWLDVCGAELEKQLVVNETVNIYDKIIIVIEGIENFKDPETGKESNIAFWLPRYFPENIKVIVTADSNSEALNHFVRLGSEIVIMETSPEMFSLAADRLNNEESILNPSLRADIEGAFSKLIKTSSIKANLYLFTEAYISSVLVAKKRSDSETLQFLKDSVERKLDVRDVEKIESLEDLYEYVIGFWNGQFQMKFKEMLMALMINQKGLTFEELRTLCAVTEREWKFFKAIFRFCLIEYKNMFMIQEPIFKATVIKRFAIKEDSVKEFHEKIADALEETPNSIRKLEEQTYHLYVSKCYFKLKEKISNIENFLLLFNPANKYDFSRYWQKLEEKGFDPVIEYNKAIEGFSMHYHPTEESIFRIIVQISRFLKEFCDFETYFTPNFRHPPIEGSMIEMDKIGLLKELQKLEIFVDSSCNKEEKVVSHPSLTEQIKELRIKYFPVDATEKKEPPGTQVQETEKNFTKNYPKEEKKPSLVINPILSEIEQLNVDVPKNREKFRAFYLNLLKDYMEQKESKENRDIGQFFLEDDVEFEAEEHKISKKERPPELKMFRVKENFNTSEVKPSLYYYKRWIWIQFPWACISLHNNYSKTPELCLTSATEYMSVETEAQFTKQALKIAIEAKERKKLMFTQKIDSQNQSKKLLFRASRSQFRNDSVDFKMKTLANTSVFEALKSINLNLQGLTKELELKRVKYSDKLERGDKGNRGDKGDKSETTKKILIEESSTFALTETKSREGDFIEKRKVFTITNPNSTVKSELLPRIKSEIKEHTTYEVKYLKGHIEQRKKWINQIIYENTKLERVYKELKIKEWQGRESSSGEGRRSRNCEELDRKKEHTITEFCKSLLQKQRLKIILKLCSENKTKNQQYLTSLNYLLQNLKKMIHWEKADMKKLHAQLQEIQQLNDLTKQASQQKEHNEQILNHEITLALQAKGRIEDQITQMSQVINEEVNLTKSRFEDNLSGDRIKNEQKNKQLQLERNAKLIEDELESMQRYFNQVSSILGITDFNFKDSPRFQELMLEKERNKELNLILFEKKNKLQELRLQLHTNRQNPNQTPSEPLPVVSSHQQKPQTKQLKYLNQTCLKFKIGFQNLSMRLKLKDKSPGNILEEVSSRLQKFKEENQEQFNRMIATQPLEASYGYSDI